MHIRVLSVFLFLTFLMHLNWASAEELSAQAPLFDHLGAFQHPISSQVPLAQRFFNQGFVLFYDFEWGESVRSFQASVRLDPQCGICYWGLALALGSKGNAPMHGHEYTDAQAAMQKATQLLPQASPAEKAYIQALSLRFRHEEKKLDPLQSFSGHTTGTELSATRKDLLEYAEAMANVAQQLPDDSDAQALYAYALFDVIEWKFWDKDGTIHPRTQTVISVLERILSKDPMHLGANHYYVHVIEQSPRPKRALANADRLKTLALDSEHIVHMPGHIYFLLGRYTDTTEANLQAIDTYKKYSKTCRDQGFEPEITYLYHHDYDFLRSSATIEGRKRLALSAAQQISENLPPEILVKDPMLQGFLAIPYFVKARFGMWDEILKDTSPDEKYPYTVGMWHYARGMALSHQGQIDQGTRESSKLALIIEQNSPDHKDRQLPENQVNLLRIAYGILSAVLADQQKDEKSTIKYLQAAAQIQKNMGYHEPPDWYFQVNEVLGNAYLKWGRPQEALAMYEIALKQYPRNGWVLYGMTQALSQLGKKQRAKEVEKEYKVAWRLAEIPHPVMLFQREK